MVDLLIRLQRARDVLSSAKSELEDILEACEERGQEAAADCASDALGYLEDAAGSLGDIWYELGD